jgi:uracil-DNA glycosylase family 4
MTSRLNQISERIVRCRLCPRLVEHRERVGREKRRQYRDWVYWAKPVPGFGDPAARLLVLGLAPAAHGGNRTGRIFTGDRSGDWLYEALYTYGFSNQPTAVHRDDGLRLRDCYVAASVRCAPPDNKPLPDEFRNCRAYLREELMLLRRVRVVVALGRIAFEQYLKACQELGWERVRPTPRFTHGSVSPLPWNVTLLGSYHPSQQNTFTGKLTRPMFHAVFKQARRLLEGGR